MSVILRGVMSPDHPRWDEFALILEGPEGCDFKQTTPGDAKTITWRCGGGYDKTYALAILTQMGFDETFIGASLAYFEASGGHCDCEILFNVDRDPEESA